MAIPELILQADALKAELDELRPLDETQKARIWQQFRLWWNNYSNSLSVAFPEIPDTEKLYSQTVSEEERRKLVRQVGSKLVEIVENQVKKAKEE